MDAYQAGQQLGSLLFGQQPTQGNPDGSPSLFDALAGRTTEGLPYYRTLTAGAQAQNAMQEARANRAKALIEEQRAAERAKLPAAVSGVYTNPAQASLVEAILGGNETSDLRDTGIYQNPNALGALAQAGTDMNAGDFPGYNQQTALAAGKPYEPVRVVDNTMLPSGVPLGDAAFAARATPVGQADITEKNALAGAANALTNQRNTLTPLKADYTQARTTATLHPPARPASGPKAQDAQLVAGFRQRIAQGKATPQQVAEFLTQKGRPDLAKQIYNPAYVVDDGSGE